MIERRAASEMEPMIATGMAMSNGQGVAITSTARKRTASPLMSPSQHGNADRDWSVNRAQLISEPPQMRLVLLGLAHHLHDFGVARIDRTARGGDGESGFTIHRAGDDSGAGRLGDLKRFASEERFVHDAIAFDDRAVDRTDVVRINDKSVAHRDVIQRDIG